MTLNSSAAAAAPIGERIIEARRGAGLSRKALATRVGMSLWTLEQIESGKTNAPQHQLSALAAATGASLEWLRARPSAAPRSPAAEADPETARLSAVRSGGRDLVLLSIALLILVRFFTEVVPVAPRALNFVDVPLFIVVAVAALVATRTRDEDIASSVSFLAPVLLFLGLCVISVVLNPSRVEPGPVLVFIYGFLAPIGFYAATHRLWPAGQAMSASRLLVALGVTQLLVVALIDLPRFLSSGNPDVISGTFGTNAYQLVFFLLVFIGLLAGIFALEPKRLTARMAPVLFIFSLVTIFLAQYRALLVTTAFCIVGIGLLLGRKGRGLIAGAIVVASFAAALSYVASAFPDLKFGTTIETFQRSPGFYATKRLATAGIIVDLYSDSPTAMIAGTGPGTFSSRAWSTFARAGSSSESNVAGGYVSALTGGSVYSTDVSEQHVLSRLQQPGGALRAVTSPFSSYTSLLAEVGVFGFLLIVFIYLKASIHAMRLAFKTVARAVPGDPLPSLLIASSVAFIALIQMALLDNWLEVARVTLPSWALLAIATKEYSARARGAA